MILTMTLLVAALWGCDSSEPAKPVSAAPGADHVSFATKTFDDHKARHYMHHTPDGILIRYFILQSSDGVIRAAFDACDVCWRSGKGYYQDGDYMVCRNCGRRFASVRVNEVRGGCNPAPLKRTVENGRLIIKVKDIEAGRQYFDFRRGGRS
ncbi:MAG: DUF2318 domain-containing protein [Proteobacteria bacterium]|nr:DUF2318 domain-containing protein [Pseudomonadota bacterium]MBU1743157.1 DUF2318 domain-containing protein [Pseudomonadota bacterium]